MSKIYVKGLEQYSAKVKAQNKRWCVLSVSLGEGGSIGQMKTVRRVYPRE